MLRHTQSTAKKEKKKKKTGWVSWHVPRANQSDAGPRWQNYSCLWVPCHRRGLSPQPSPVCRTTFSAGVHCAPSFLHKCCQVHRLYKFIHEPLFRSPSVLLFRCNTCYLLYCEMYDCQRNTLTWKKRICIVIKHIHCNYAYASTDISMKHICI